MLVRVHAAGLNGADMHPAAGATRRHRVAAGHPRPRARRRGAGRARRRRFAGRRPRDGDRRRRRPGRAGVVHERQAMPVPAASTGPQAGGFPEVFTTAHDALFTQAGLQPGERLLVHGAAGGVGTAAVQLGGRGRARHGDGAQRRPAATPSPSSAPSARPGGLRGARPVRRDPRARRRAEPRANLERSRTGGRIVVIGVGAGAKAEVNLLRADGQARPDPASTLRARPLEEKARRRARWSARCCRCSNRARARSRGRDVPAGRGRRGLRALRRRRQARQDRGDDAMSTPLGGCGRALLEPGRAGPAMADASLSAGRAPESSGRGKER